MAENQIDKLSLSINVKDNDSAKKILQVSNAIRNLTNSLKGLDKVSAQIKSLQSVFSGVGALSRGGGRKPKATGEDVLKKSTLQEPSYEQGKLPPIGSKNTQGFLPNLKEFLAGAKLVSEQEKILKDGTKQVIEVYEELKDGFKTTTTVINGVVKSTKKVAVAEKEVADETEKASKATKKATGFFGSFVKSIGRIALYRAIRTALKEITQAFTEGVQNYARYNKETNQAMSNIMNSTNQLKNTLGVTLGSILQSLAPILETLAGLATDLFNNINMALASMQGKNTYSKAIKQNEDYAKSLDKVNGKLLSFDTFNTLATDNGSKGLFEEVEITDNLSEWGKFFKDFSENLSSIFELVKEIIGLAKPFLESLAPLLSGAVKAIRGIVDLLIGIIKLFTGDFEGAFESLGKAFGNLFKGFVNSAIGFLNFLIDAINLLIIKLNPISWIFGTFGIDISIPHIPTAFANGGSFNTADMFYANENGNTELIASSNRGGAVMNMEQLQSAIYNGMILAMADSGDKEIVLRVDNNTLGRVVANSTGFISETNRRNSSLKLV